MMATLRAATYVARDRCGCCVGLRLDKGDTFSIARDVAEFIRAGYRVERVDWSTCIDVRNEPTFLNCPHGQLSLPIGEGE